MILLKNCLKKSLAFGGRERVKCNFPLFSISTPQNYWTFLYNLI